MDGELPERACRELETHLADCPACRRALDELRGLARYLAIDKAPPAPAGLSARILARAASRRQRVFQFQTWLVEGATAAALIAGLALGAWMGNASRPAPAAGQRVSDNMYAFDVLSADPRDSIEAATLALLADGR